MMYTPTNSNIWVSSSMWVYPNIIKFDSGALFWLLDYTYFIDKLNNISISNINKYYQKQNTILLL